MRFDQWIMMSLSVCLLACSLQAQPAAKVPKNALGYVELRKLRDLPKSDVVSFPALVKDMQGSPVLLWEQEESVTLNLPLSGVGKYLIEVAHLSGGRYAPIKLSTLNAVTVESAVVKGETQLQITRLQTGLVPGQRLELTLNTSQKNRAMGVAYVTIRVQDYAPITAEHWQMGLVEKDMQSCIEQYQLNQPGQLNMPRDLKPLESKSPKVFGANDGSMVAMTYLFHDQAFTGYNFQLKANADAMLLINGLPIITLVDGQRQGTGDARWNKLLRGVNRVAVVMAKADGIEKTRWFELGMGDTKHAQFFANIPRRVDPRIVNTDWPRVTLSKADVRAVLPLPDQHKGFYRSVRFDWSGQITEFEVGKHSIFAPFHDELLPVGIDYAAGPAEEFFEPAGYDEASYGEPFMKIGVGLLRRPVEANYFFGSMYWPVKFFDWKTDIQKDHITFTQEGKGPNGYGYHYVKTLRLTTSPKGLVIEHTLTNTGSKRIVTHHYSHNFIRINDADIDSRYRVNFGFKPTMLNNVSGRMQLKGSQATPLGKKTIFTPIIGYTDQLHSHVSVMYEPDAVQLDIRLDQPLSRFWFFASNRTVCPELFTHIDLSPGQTKRWVSSYEVRSK